MNKAMVWPCAVVGLLGMNAAIVGVTVYLAASNTTMTPEPRYYERAVHFDDQIAQRRENDRLGWSSTAALSIPAAGGPRLIVRLFDRAGDPISGAAVHAEVIPNLRPKSRATVELAGIPGDGYGAPVPSSQGGLWTVRIEARRGGDVYTAELSTPMPAAEAPGSVPEGRR